MNLTTATTNMNFTLFKETVHGANFFGIGILLFIVLLFILVLLITRDTSKWIIVALPLVFILHGLGVSLSTNQLANAFTYTIIKLLLLTLWVIYVYGPDTIGTIFNVPISLGTYRKNKKIREKRHEKEYIEQEQLQRQFFDLNKELGQTKPKQTAQNLIDEVTASHKYKPTKIQVYKQ